MEKKKTGKKKEKHVIGHQSGSELCLYDEKNKTKHIISNIKIERKSAEYSQLKRKKRKKRRGKKRRGVFFLYVDSSKRACVQLEERSIKRPCLN